MANPDAPFGFRPASHGGGGTPARTNSMRTYRLSTAYNTALFRGDAVKSDGSGNVVISTAGDALAGIFAGVEWIGSDGKPRWANSWTASTAEKSGTAIIAHVWDDPNMIFEAQSDGSMTRADVNQFCNAVYSVAGNATTGISGQQTSATGGSESQFVIVDVYDSTNSKPTVLANGTHGFLATGTNAVVKVKIAKHELAGSATAVEA